MIKTQLIEETMNYKLKKYIVFQTVGIHQMKGLNRTIGTNYYLNIEMKMKTSFIIGIKVGWITSFNKASYRRVKNLVLIFKTMTQPLSQQRTIIIWFLLNLHTHLNQDTTLHKLLQISRINLFQEGIYKDRV